MSPKVLDAQVADLPGILAIYNDAVLKTTAIFNETPVELANREQWFADRVARGFPVFVTRDADGAVSGYASYGDFRPFFGYRFTVEHSVYIREDRRGQGLGGHLLAALCIHAKAKGLHVMVGGIGGDNAASLALHARHGFVEVGRMPEVGVKFGRWLDLVFMQKML